MNRHVLVIGAEHDASVRAVLVRLLKNKGIKTSLLDGRVFGERIHAVLACDQGYFDIDGARVAVEEFTAIWNRRWHDPNAVRAMPTESGIRDFARENWRQFVTGILNQSPATWVNHPLKQAAAANKLTQVRWASSLGLSVPDTLFSDSPEAVRQFLLRHSSGVVCKTIGTTFTSASPSTVLLKPGHLDEVDRIQVCPAIFQEFIPVERDIRVIVIGDELFAAEVDTKRSGTAVDWRIDSDNPWHEHNLPLVIADLCILLTSELGLRYGAIDLRLKPDGAYVFFEINPAGQFLFQEVWTGQPIASCLASYLAHCR